MNGDMQRITRLFIHAFGLVHVFNAIGLVVQVNRLFCSEGLIPVARFIARLNENVPGGLERFFTHPSVFHFFHADWFIICCAWLILLCAIAAMAGFYSRWAFVLLFILYNSFVNTGQELYSFQWDSLILETTFLAIWLPDSRWFFRNTNTRLHPILHGLFLWLLFRLYCESGVAKLFWGPESWSTLEAMSHYYETAPLPTPLGYYAHFLPESWHRFETIITLIIEILIPGLIFGPKPLKRIAFLSFTLLQICIILTANYGVFNYNTLALHLFLLQDSDLRFTGKLFSSIADASDEPRKTFLRAKGYLYPVAFVVVLLSCIEFTMFAGGMGIHKTILPRIARYTTPWHIASRYHLFGPIDPIRYELVIETTRDGKHWQALDFPFKAGRPDKPLRFIAPFHPRVDFRLWFERYPVRWPEGVSMPYEAVTANPQILTPYLSRLIGKLLRNDPRVWVHFSNPPLETSPVKAVRITYYHYNMVPPGSFRNQKRIYWTRKTVGTVYFNPSLGKNNQPAIVRGIVLPED